MFKNLRSKILLYFVIIVVCITAGIISIVLLNAKATIEKDLQDKHSVVSQQAHNVISETVERSFGDIAMLSSNAIIRSPNSSLKDKQQELMRLKEIIRFYEDISLLDLNGRIITSTDYSFRGQPQYQPYFKKAITGKIAMSNVRAIPDPFKIVLNFAGPVYNPNNELTYVISVQLNMNTIWKLVDDIKIGETGFLYIVNDKQIIIGSKNKDILLSNLPKELRSALHENKPLLYHDTAKRTILGAFYIPDPSRPDRSEKKLNPHNQSLNWTVFSFQQKAEAFGVLYTFVTQVLLFSILALIGVIILGIRYSYSLTKPLVQLTQNTEAIGEGRWDQLKTISTNDEIGQLADSFQKMATQLKNMTAYVHDIVSSMPSIIIGVDMDISTTLWNAEASRITGVSSKQAIGKSVFDVFPMLLSEKERITNALNTQKIQRYHRMVLEKEGSKEFFEVTVYPLSAREDGAVLRIDNITRRVKMEEMIVQTEKMLSLGGLAAGMAHEINNPLSGISQNAQLLKQRLLEELPKNHSVAAKCNTTFDAVKTYCISRELDLSIKTISQATQRASAIVGNMLSFSRKSTSSKKDCNLTELIDETVDLISNDYSLKKRWDFKKIKIIKNYVAPYINVECERSQIQQVIFNILKNGAEAMASRPSPKDPPCFKINIFKHNTVACIHISDNGIGMPESVQKRVFEPFFTTKEVGQGTGLGLSVSYFIITENHRGTMRVDSTEGQGTRFVIELPQKATD